MATTLGDGIFLPNINSGLDISQYNFPDIIPGVVNGLRLDARKCVFDARDINTLVSNGAEVIINSDQFPADTIGRIAMNASQGGGALHVVDKGELVVPANYAMQILGSGAHWYHHSGTPRDIASLRALAQRASNGGYFFEYLYGLSPDFSISAVRDISRANGDVEIRVPASVLTAIDISTALSEAEFHGYDKHLSDGIFCQLSGMDLGLYDSGLLNLVANGQMFDGRNDRTKELIEYSILARRGCSLILNTVQISPLELGALAAAFKEGGGRLHLIDYGDLMSDQLGDIGADGAFIYYHDGIRRRRDFQELENITQRTGGKGRFAYFDYNGYLDTGSLQGLVSNGAFIEYRAIRPFTHILAVQSAASSRGLPARALMDYHELQLAA